MPEDLIAFPVLTDAEIRTLRDYGAEAKFSAGSVLWNVGDSNFCFFVVLSGGVAIREDSSEATQIVYHSIGQFTGNIDILYGRPAPLAGFVDGETTLLQISADNLREIIRVEQTLGGKLLAAFISRQEKLLSSGLGGPVLVGCPLDPETVALRNFLSRNRVVHRWKRTDEESTEEIMSAFGLLPADTPMVLIGSERLIRPSVNELATKLGIRRATDKEEFDLVIIGAGPAGLAAAVYGSSEGLKTLLLERASPGGQASWSSRIENYMGFPEGLTGSDLASRGLVQAQKFGVRFSIPADVEKIECVGHGSQIHLDTGEVINARAVLLATGAAYTKLNVEGFDKFEAKNIFYAATRLETELCSDSDVAIVGAGNSAGQAAVFLAETAKNVHLIVRGDQLSKSMSEYLSYRIENIPNIHVHLQTQISALQGNGKLTAASLDGPVSETIPCDGLFVFIGAKPNTGFVKEIVSLDKNGFVLTGDTMRGYWDETRMPYYLETSCPGIFAAGDCRSGSVKRVASSVGEGSMAVTFVHRFLSL